MKGKKLTQSIKRTVRRGFFILGTILFFSSIIAIFEFRRINDAGSGVINDNILSLNAARTLMVESEGYNIQLLSMLNNDEFIVLDKEEPFSQMLESMRNNFTTEEEIHYADSVRYAYAAYMQVIREAPLVWQEGFDARTSWYFGRAQKYFNYLRNSIAHLTDISQRELRRNSEMMESTFFRSMMPAVAALIVGLIVILLFNSFINYYLISPINKMNQSLRDFSKYGKDYILYFSEDDELEDLNNAIKDIVEESKLLKSKK